MYICKRNVCIVKCSMAGCIPVSAGQNKHMFVYSPVSGRSVVINASLVDVSPILILHHDHSEMNNIVIRIHL